MAGIKIGHVRVEIDAELLDKEASPVMQARLASLTRRIANQARADVPVRTGNLGRTIGELPQVVSPFRVSGGVEATADYAAPVHEGHGVIYPKHARFLHFWVGDREVFARRVKAVAARPFLRNAGVRVAGSDPGVNARG